MAAIHEPVATVRGGIGFCIVGSYTRGKHLVTHTINTWAKVFADEKGGSWTPLMRDSTSPNMEGYFHGVCPSPSPFGSQKCNVTSSASLYVAYHLGAHWRRVFDATSDGVMVVVVTSEPGAASFSRERDTHELHEIAALASLHRSKVFIITLQLGMEKIAHSAFLGFEETLLGVVHQDRPAAHPHPLMATLLDELASRKHNAVQYATEPDPFPGIFPSLENHVMAPANQPAVRGEAKVPLRIRVVGHQKKFKSVIGIVLTGNPTYETEITTSTSIGAISSGKISVALTSIESWSPHDESGKDAVFGPGSRICFRVTSGGIARDAFPVGSLLGNRYGPGALYSPYAMVAYIKRAPASLSMPRVAARESYRVHGTYSHTSSSVRVASVLPQSLVEAVCGRSTSELIGEQEASVDSGDFVLLATDIDFEPVCCQQRGITGSQLLCGARPLPAESSRWVSAIVVDSWRPMQINQALWPLRPYPMQSDASSDAAFSQGDAIHKALTSHFSMQRPVMQMLLQEQSAWSAVAQVNPAMVLQSEVENTVYFAQCPLVKTTRTDMVTKKGFKYPVEETSVVYEQVSLLHIVAKFQSLLGGTPLVQLLLSRIVNNGDVMCRGAGSSLVQLPTATKTSVATVATLVTLPPADLPDRIVTLAGSELLSAAMKANSRVSFVQLLKRKTVQLPLSDDFVRQFVFHNNPLLAKVPVEQAAAVMEMVFSFGVPRNLAQTTYNYTTKYRPLELQPAFHRLVNRHWEVAVPPLIRHSPFTAVRWMAFLRSCAASRLSSCTILENIFNFVNWRSTAV